MEENFDIVELINELSCGDENLKYILLSVMDEERMYLNLLTCKYLDIKGDKLYDLYSKCSSYNYIKFINTIMMFRLGIYTKEEIHQNLESNIPLEFIDDSIKYNNKDFKKYAYNQRMNFLFKRDLNNSSIIKKHF